MNAIPPKLESSTPRWIFSLLAIAVGLGGIVIYFFNPSTSRFYPVCHFHQITGLNCPGCGGTRSLYALLHGDLPAAFRDNALFVSLLAATGLRGGWFALNSLRGRRNGPFFQVRFLWPLLVVVVVFTALRNLPAFAFLSPAP